MVDPRSTFRPVDPAVLDTDPFWGPVRQRHPDLDVIILPPDVEPERVIQPLAEVREAAAEVLATWRLLQPLVGVADTHEPGRGPSVRWEHRDGDVLVVQRALIGIGQDAGTAFLREVVLALGEAGWRLRPGRRQGLPLLDATDGNLHVEAVAGPGATVLTITGPGLAAGEADREMVRDEVLAEVAR